MVRLIRMVLISFAISALLASCGGSSGFQTSASSPVPTPTPDNGGGTGGGGGGGEPRRQSCQPIGATTASCSTARSVTAEQTIPLALSTRNSISQLR